jgi:serine/threonine protein kinase
MEMAVLSLVQHPNIVQLYSHLTDVVEAPGEACGALRLPPRRPSSGGLAAWGSAAVTRAAYRRLHPGEAAPPGAQPCNIIIIEWCDRGSLRDVARSGALAGGGAAALLALSGVASALAYLHSCGIAHGDVKVCWAGTEARAVSRLSSLLAGQLMLACQLLQAGVAQGAGHAPTCLVLFSRGARSSTTCS